MIFICGPGRSGSTMLQAILDGHPSLAVFPLEFNIFFTYLNILKRYGRVSARSFADYLKLNTRFRFLGSVMPMNQGQDIDLQGVDAESFWEFFAGAGDAERSPAELLGLLAEAYARSVYGQGRRVTFVLRSNNLHLAAYRTLFPGARFLYTVRNPVDLFIGYLKYHATDSFSLSRAMEYRELVKSTLDLIRISLNRELHGYDQEDTLYVRLEDLQSGNQQCLEEVTAFAGMEFHPALQGMTILGNSYGGNKVQKIAPSHGSWLGVLSGKGYLTPFEREALKGVLAGLPPGPYDLNQAAAYADQVLLRLPSTFIFDLVRNSLTRRGQGREGDRGRFSYKFPLDFQR